jgi:UDPglucose 6-dehydrogenase
MILLAGYGYVGKAIHETFKDVVDIYVVDPKHNKNKMSDFNPEKVIIAVSTPEGKNGECDMTNVFDVLKKVAPAVPVLIKSTISIEGWHTLKKKFPDHRVTFSPEFLRAKTATQDFQTTKHIYLAGQWGHGWIPFFKKIFPTAQYSVRKTPEELIAGKYFRNAFLATKVTFFNQLYDFCEKYDLKWEQVREVVTDDIRIGRDHTDVTEERGFGGHCLPKDTKALSKSASKAKLNLSLIEEVLKYNDDIKKL